MNKLALILAGCGLAGCANFKTVYRPLDLDSREGGKAVAIDGYQSPIFTNTVEMGVDGKLAANQKMFVVCPSPPVEAITAFGFGSALGDKLSAVARSSGDKIDNELRASISSAMAAASIGLRTNSTTLLSYNSAWNCLASMGGATKDRRFMELARRNQNITLGVLAIEQLTGPVRAGQAMLNSGSSSGAGQQDTSIEEARVTSAQSERDAAVTTLTERRAIANDVRLSKAEQDKKVAAAAAAVDKEKKVKDSPKLAELEASLKAETDAQTESNRQAREAEDSVAAAQRDVASANDHLKRAQEALTSTRLAVRSSAQGSAEITAAGGPMAVVSKEVAGKVLEIVKAVLQESGKGEACNAVIDDWMAIPTKYAEGSGPQIIRHCLDVKALEIAKEEAALPDEVRQEYRKNRSTVPQAVPQAPN